jgi:bifunctional DNA-binding transcriptional regulator/antitoxin component of YhaV-PrlF toxin-antitoxin module
MSTVVGTKGQVTIEKDIREALGVRPGWRAIQRRVGNQVVISFRPPKHRESLLGFLSDPQGPHLASSAEFQAAVERAWDEAAMEACQTAAETAASATTTHPPGRSHDGG